MASSRAYSNSFAQRNLDYEDFKIIAREDLNVR